MRWSAGSGDIATAVTDRGGDPSTGIATLAPLIGAARARA
jgi:hypothetical protein